MEKEPTIIAPKWLDLVLKLPFALLAAIISIYLALYFTQAILFVQPFIHESGHLAACLASGQIRGIATNCSITNWSEYSLLGDLISLEVPQQTRVQPFTILTAFGGPILSILFFLSGGIVVRGTLKIKNRFYWLIPATIIFYEIESNVLCGTDNWTNNPFQFCSNELVNTATTNFPPLIVFAIALLLYPPMEKFIEKIRIAYIEKLKTTKMAMNKQGR